MASFREESISLGLAHSHRGLVPYHRGKEYGGTQADIGLEKELRLLHLVLQVAGEGRHPGPGLGF